MAKEQKTRIYLLDELRGIGIIYVMLYHLLYDIFLLYPIVDIPWFFSGAFQMSRVVVVVMLMVISGVSCSLSKNNLKRGLVILAFAMAITVVTFFLMPASFIVFGILHFFAVSILIYCVVGKWLKKLPPLLFTVIFAVLFVGTYDIYDGIVGILSLGLTVDVPSFLYDKFYLVPLGFGMQGFSSVDYYPLIPWIFAFFVGALWGDSLKTKKAPQFFYKKHISALGIIGKHTLILYIIHQPIFFALAWLIYTVTY